MKPEKIFKRYDIRGKYPEELDEEFSRLLGKALGTFVHEKFGTPIVVCRDNKNSSEGLKNELMLGLKDTGAKVFDVGIGPTDYASFSGKNLGGVSVEVTSSHMPLDFNGFKIMYPEGNGFLNNDLYAVQDIFRERKFIEGTGSVVKEDLMPEYKEELKLFAEKYGATWDKKIVLDSLGGTAHILSDLLEDMGAEIIDLSKNNDRIYADPPNPKPCNLNRLKSTVEESDAYLGIANDLDADRVTVYRDGKFLTGDEVFLLLSQQFEGPVVASIDTSQVLENYTEVHYTRVGDPFVLDKALDLDAKLAGEPNGHYAMTDFVPYNSGILSGLIVAGLDIDQQLSDIPDYYISRSTVEVEEKNKVIEFLKNKLTDKEFISDLDGVKFLRKDTEVLVRPSGSSQKVRLICEGRDEDSVREVLKDVMTELNCFCQKH